MSVCCRRQMRIPEEVSLSGFDNILLSTQVVVPLTTVEQPIVEMCSAAIGIINDKLRRRAALSPESEEHVFPCRIIWRDSMRLSLD